MPFLHFSQYHHPAYRSKASNQFSSRTYKQEDPNLVQQHNSIPSVIFGQRVTSENKYSERLNANLNMIPNNNDILKVEYFDYDDYDNDEDYYEYEYDHVNASSNVNPVQRNDIIPIRSPNPPTRRNSYLHYNHHGTYLPLTPPRSETHYDGYEHVNRRPVR